MQTCLEYKNISQSGSVQHTFLTHRHNHFFIFSAVFLGLNITNVWLQCHMKRI